MRNIKPTPEVSARRTEVESMCPRSGDELHRFVEVTLNVRAVRRAVVPGNDAPFAYLCAAFFEGGAGGGSANGAGDLIVWANRGGGKTMLGAVATLLDLLFKPGIQVRILGGSLQQSQRMYEYLREMIVRELFRPLLAKEPTEREIALVSGSVVRLLTQSPTSVRGEHVHKLRCDEVDDYDPDVWTAAQLATKSGKCGDTFVRGRIEALSTMHHPFGPMSKLIERAMEAQAQARGAAARVLRWSALDVIERCPADRPCEGCRLWNDCGGRAKEAAGYIAVDDMIRLHDRTSQDAWAAEMMCLRASRQSLVYHRFDPTPGGKHVMIAGPAAIHGTATPIPLPLREGPGEGGAYHLSRGRPDVTRRPFPDPSLRGRGTRSEAELVGGMDFGMRDPFVMLWARLLPPVDGPARPRGEDWTIEVIGELIENGLTMEQAVDRMESMGRPRPKWIGIDPAGGQCNRQTGISDADYLRRRGYRTVSQASRIAQGIEIIRRRLDRGTLRIDAGCRQLIQSLAEYHFDAQDERKETPVKDGPDHACDALRYLVVSLEMNGWGVEVGRW
jgi:hypothetical protein